MKETLQRPPEHDDPFAEPVVTEPPTLKYDYDNPFAEPVVVVPEPSELDTQLEKAKKSRLNRALGAAGRMLGFDPKVIQLTSDRVADLSAIKGAESPLEETKRQLEKAKKSRLNRALGAAGRMLGFDPKVMALSSDRVARLSRIHDDLSRKR